MMCLLFEFFLSTDIDNINITLHASEQERPRCEGKTQSMEREYVRVRP